MREEGAAIFARWSPLISDWRQIPAARNLAAYLALRQHDISDLQPALVAYGVSSLGRSEAHVMGSMDALCATLAAIAGIPGYRHPPPGRMTAGEAALRRAQKRLFGPDVIGASTRIMVTLPGEAATDRTLVRSLVGAGMTCARINCAHDDAATWQAMAEMVRTEAAAAGRECRVLMDIGGPKCRIETIHAADRVRLFRGNRIVMVRDLSRATAADAVITTITFPELLEGLMPGKEVWINDGKIGTRVVAAEDGRVDLEVFSARAKGERLRPEKGVNFVDMELHLVR